MCSLTLIHHSDNLTKIKGFLFLNKGNLNEGELIEKYSEISFESYLTIAPLWHYKIYFENINENGGNFKLIRIINSIGKEELTLIKTKENKERIKKINNKIDNNENLFLENCSSDVRSFKNISE